MIFTLIVTFFACASAAVSSEDITDENWNHITDRKSVFIMFHAPGCDQCKQDRPMFKKLKKKFRKQPDAFIGDVDCTEDGKALCEQLGIESVPSYLFGDPNMLNSYAGTVGFDAISSFITENLKPFCGPFTHDLCSTEERKLMDDFMQMPLIKLDTAIKENEIKMKELRINKGQVWKELREKYAEVDQRLQSAKRSKSRSSDDIEMLEQEASETDQQIRARFTKMEEKTSKKLDAVRSTGLSLMKQVRAIRLKKGPKSKKLDL